MGQHAMACVRLLENRRGIITLREFPSVKEERLQALLGALLQDQVGTLIQR